MSSPSIDPVAFAMRQTIDDLRSKWTQVANKVNAGSTVMLNGAEESIDNALKITGQSIGILGGTIKTDAHGNLFEAALTNEDTMAFWMEYAQQTGDTLNQALKLQKYDVAQFFRSVGGNLVDLAEKTAEGTMSALPWIAVIAVAVLLIVVLK